ncbi:MAG: hypothetical protein WBA41_12850 [Rivularia sp. (in: cyanobacteria)]
MMTPELLKSYQQHAHTLLDLTEEIKTIAEDCNVEQLLGTVRGGLTDIVRAIEPNNELAIAMIADTVNIDCEIDQSEFLGNVAAAVFNVIKGQLEVATN